ncbi:MAG: anaerobic ribonucleoside-triphosphate reductase activating protein [Lachnospiraceae bacterium]|nr:anaerobic ribonucleoside-triphosphate reductase activating protein [Lachnospiraceae bacterium]
MRIGGFLPTTLLDYPEKLACTVFTCGCNFRCPFCQNGSLVLGTHYDLSGSPDTTVSENAGTNAASVFSMASNDDQGVDILEHIKKRKNILEGVCITGGEPTLQKDLSDFLRKVKNLGLLVKLDTNGSRPDIVKALYQEDLIDYVAMDIKSSKEGYSAVSGIAGLPIAAIEESVEFLMHSGIAYEFRTTLVKGLHTHADMESIATWLKGAEKYYLQSYEDSDLILCKLMSSSSPGSMTHTTSLKITDSRNTPFHVDFTLETFSTEELQQFLQIAQTSIPSAVLRGVEMPAS